MWLSNSTIICNVNRDSLIAHSRECRFRDSSFFCLTTKVMNAFNFCFSKFFDNFSRTFDNFSKSLLITRLRDREINTNCIDRVEINFAIKRFERRMRDFVCFCSNCENVVDDEMSVIKNLNDCRTKKIVNVWAWSITLKILEIFALIEDEALLEISIENFTIDVVEMMTRERENVRVKSIKYVKNESNVEMLARA